MGFTSLRRAKIFRSIRTPRGKHPKVPLHPSTLLFFGVLFLAGSLEAKADLIGYYALETGTVSTGSGCVSDSNFELCNSGGLIPNGYVSSPDPTTLILTGTNDGSGLPGTTTLTIASEASGFFDFNWSFSTFDTPGSETAGYLLNGTFFKLADTDGESCFNPVCSPPLSVVAGETIGFEIMSLDNTGSAGILTITSFSAPASAVAPEPGTLVLLLIGTVGVFAARRLKLKQLLRRAVALVAVAAVCMTLPAFAQQVSYTGTNVTGQLTMLPPVNFTSQALASDGGQAFQGPAAPETLRVPPPRLHPPFSAKKLLGAQVAPAPLQGFSVVQASGASGFNALSHLDQRNANGGNQFSIEPPNQSVAVGNGYVLEGVNDAVEVFNTSGSPSLPMVLSSNQVFGLAPAIDRKTGINGVYLTDMRVFFDPGMGTSGRWIVLQRSQANDSAGNPLNMSQLYIAVSQSGDPTGNYNIYVMDTTNAYHPGCPCIDDYPQIGADYYGFHVAWNEFTTSGLSFVDASILSLSKSDLAGGAATPSAYQFLLPFNSGFEFAIQPATAPPGAANFVANGGVEYFVSTSGRFAADNQLALWAMSGTSSLATENPSPILVQITIPALNYTSPDVATQPSGYDPLGISQESPTEYLDGGDTRVQCLTYAGGNLYLTFPTGVTDQNGHFVVGGAYVVLSPTYRFGTLAAQILNEGYLLVNGNHLLRPALAVNAKGRGAIGVTLVGSAGGYYPSAAFIPFQASAVPTTVEIAAPGALPEDGFTGYPIGGGDGVARWGDYNTAVAGSDGSIWMAVQYIGNYPRTQNANWNTYVANVQP